MSTNSILPEFIEFGDTDEFYPDLEDIESFDLTEGPSGLEEVDEYGYDIVFSFGTGSLQLSPSGDVKVTSTEKQALTQWIGVALASPRGRDLLYSERFGSTLEDLVGQEVPLQGVESSIKSMINDTLLQHDRIVEMRDFTFDFSIDNTLLTIGFVVVTDDSAELVFEGLQLGR